MKSLVSVEWNGIPCVCRCRHCLLSNGERTAPKVSYQRAKAVAERFIWWSASQGDSGIPIRFGIGSSYETDSETLIDYTSFRQANNMDGWDYLPLNGLRKRSREDIRRYLLPIRDAGLRVVNLSFHGCRESHDSFAGRSVDFDYLITMAEVMAELGIERSEMILLRRSVMTELPSLLKALDALPGTKQRIGGIQDYLGRAVRLEDERLFADDLGRVPEALLSTLNCGRYRTESEWLETIRAGAVPEPKWCLYVVGISDENINYLESSDCSDILQGITDDEAAIKASSPLLIELCATYGDTNNRRLYTFRDMESRLRGRYYEDTSPEVLPVWFDPSSSRIRMY